MTRPRAWWECLGPGDEMAPAELEPLDDDEPIDCPDCAGIGADEYGTPCQSCDGTGCGEETHLAYYGRRTGDALDTADDDRTPIDLGPDWDAWIARTAARACGLRVVEP